MNNHRLLTGLFVTALLSGGVRAMGQSRQVYSLERLFEIAETNSTQLRPSFAAEEQSRREISVAQSNRLPDIKANLSLSYIGDGLPQNVIFLIIKELLFHILVMLSG